MAVARLQVVSQRAAEQEGVNMGNTGKRQSTAKHTKTRSGSFAKKPLSESYLRYKKWIAAGRPGGKFPG